MELRLGHRPLLISSIPILLFFVAVENDVDRSIARVFLTEQSHVLACTDRFRIKL